MSEVRIAHDSYSAENVRYAGEEMAMEVVTIPQTEEQLELGLDSLQGEHFNEIDQRPQVDRSTDPDYLRQQWDQEQSALLAELLQLRSLTHHYVERIQHLEQALDQSLVSLNELRHQLIDQQFLENQLASTEEIANIQQQAINRLKLQLAEQQEALESQLNQTQDRDLAFHTLLATMETLTQTQQSELDHLRNQISIDRIQAQTQRQTLETELADLQVVINTQQQRILELESQNLTARTQAGELEVQLERAKAQITELTQHVVDRQSTIDQVEAELKKAHHTIDQQPTLILSSSTASRGTRRTNPIAERELAIAEGKVEELETEIARQLTAQAMLQQACQELEQERDRQQRRISEMEQQTADMQEQILRQAQQASEYETAIQHLKDRHLGNHSQLLRLQELLSEVPNLSPEVSTVLADLLSASSVSELPSPTLLPPSKPPKVDLPEFLMRRRSYKARRS